MYCFRFALSLSPNNAKDYDYKRVFLSNRISFLDKPDRNGHCGCPLLFGVLKGLDIYTRHGEAVVVPNVKGMGVAEAEKCSATKDLPALFPTPAM